MTILVTGGAGFIGSHFILDWLLETGEPVINLDALTYAGNLENLAVLQGNALYDFVCGDIQDRRLVDRLLVEHAPRAIVHFAAESHVDRSINRPQDFIQTNIVGTYTLLEAARSYWSKLQYGARSRFRFLQVSTDEVYGSLGAADPAFSEASLYQPNSPYSASKAAADHLVRAWHHTYGLPVLTTNCSNNYGPRQFPEKLIPLIIANAMDRKPLPIYGDGMNVRDWLHVGDHCMALRIVLERGIAGQMYNIGGNSEMTNLAVVHNICELLDEMRPHADGPYSNLITFVQDRAGHDRRYAIDARKIGRDLGWQPTETFSSGMRKTLLWYLDHQEWVSDVKTGAYQQWTIRNSEARA